MWEDRQEEASWDVCWRYWWDHTQQQQVHQEQRGTLRPHGKISAEEFTRTNTKIIYYLCGKKGVGKKGELQARYLPKKIEFKFRSGRNTKNHQVWDFNTIEMVEWMQWNLNRFVLKEF